MISNYSGRNNGNNNKNNMIPVDTARIIIRESCWYCLPPLVEDEAIRASHECADQGASVLPAFHKAHAINSRQELAEGPSCTLRVQEPTREGHHF